MGTSTIPLSSANGSKPFRAIGDEEARRLCSEAVPII